MDEILNKNEIYINNLDKNDILKLNLNDNEDIDNKLYYYLKGRYNYLKKNYEEAEKYFDNDNEYDKYLEKYALLLTKQYEDNGEIPLGAEFDVGKYYITLYMQLIMNLMNI